jgi:hypothetical protein
MNVTSKAQISPEHLLAEIEELLRIAPSPMELLIPSPDNFAWQGRASAAVRRWDGSEGVMFDSHARAFGSGEPVLSEPGYIGMLVVLNKARADIRMTTVGPVAIAVAKGQVFDYFDELRKAIEPARKEVFFIDRWLDAEFASRYMPHVNTSASARLLTTAKASQTLLPAIESFCTQNGLTVAVRTSNEMHDRYLFVDRAQGYHSGASFKDGGRLSPTTLTQITDAFAPVLATYETMWNAGTVVRA